MGADHSRIPSGTPAQITSSKLKQELTIRNLPTHGNKYDMLRRLDEDAETSRLNTERTKFYERIIYDLECIPEMEVIERKKIWQKMYKYYCVQFLATGEYFELMKSQSEFLIYFANVAEEILGQTEYDTNFDPGVINTIVNVICGVNIHEVHYNKIPNSKLLYALYGNLVFDEEMLGHEVSMKTRKDLIMENPYRIYYFNEGRRKSSGSTNYVVNKRKLLEILDSHVVDRRYVSIERVIHSLEMLREAMLREVPAAGK